MKQWVLAALVATTMAGCAHMGPPTAAPRPPFPAEEYAALEGRTGTGVVTGQAFLRTRGGDVKVGAGSEVNLNPVTSYSEYWYVSMTRGQALQEPDPRMHKYLFVTQADAEGKFRFENVPAGEYFLTGKVTWEAPGRYYSSTQGGWISERITVRDGETVTQMLTR